MIINYCGGGEAAPVKPRQTVGIVDGSEGKERYRRQRPRWGGEGAAGRRADVTRGCSGCFKVVDLVGWGEVRIHTDGYNEGEEGLR